MKDQLTLFFTQALLFGFPMYVVQIFILKTLVQISVKIKWGGAKGLHSTELVFALLTQWSRVRILALSRFFSL